MGKKCGYELEIDAFIFFCSNLKDAKFTRLNCALCINYTDKKLYK